MFVLLHQHVFKSRNSQGLRAKLSCLSDVFVYVKSKTALGTIDWQRGRERELIGLAKLHRSSRLGGRRHISSLGLPFMIIESPTLFVAPTPM